MPLLIPTTGKPRIILGLMTFGPSESDGARITDLGTYNQVLDKFQERGYNEVDTARVYVGGAQEAFTREAKWKERGLTLATKVKYPGADGDNVAQKVIESVELSLKELGTDCVDVCCAMPPAPRPPHRRLPFLITSMTDALSALTYRSSTSTPPTAQPPSRRPSLPSTSFTRPASSSVSE
jgi:aryl-alcohol dehydrogenase-like predicted oxidoreductase